MLYPGAISEQAFTGQMIDFLQRPASYLHMPARVEIRQTHASILAIAPPYVFKVKKQVNLGFMDFTSLDARKTNAEREIRLNSRLSPGLYVGIIPITSTDGKLSFDGEGTLVDYALQMHQLEDGFFMDQLLEKGQVAIPMMEAILEKLAAFYKKQPPEKSLQAYGSVESISANVLDNLQGIREHMHDKTSAVLLPVLHFYVTRYITRQASLFEKRLQANRIKDCHGDLHLEHIHVKNGQITIYDCIEFNDQFRYSDVAADIAFLAMDLDFHQRPDLSAFVSEHMSELLEDREMADLMDFYKCYRASVRAKVSAIQATEKEVNEADKQISSHLSHQYLQLALRYAVLGSVPMAVIICGRVGTGKSTLARHLAESLNVFYLGSDEVRKQQAGLPLYSRTDPEKRKALYAKEVSQAMYETLLQRAQHKVAANQSIVLDATFSKQAYRTLFRETFEKQQISYLFIEMQASDEVIKLRLAGREHSKQEVSDARLEDFETLSQVYQPPIEIPSAQLIQVNTGSGVEALLEKVCRQLIYLQG